MNVLRAIFIIAIWIVNSIAKHKIETKNFVQIVNEVLVGQFTGMHVSKLELVAICEPPHDPKKKSENKPVSNKEDCHPENKS